MPVDDPVPAEAANVEAWRLLRLLEAGYRRDRAEQLARDDGVDLHQAVELLEHGCDQKLALKILL